MKGLKYIKLLVEEIHSITVATIGTDGFGLSAKVYRCF